MSIPVGAIVDAATGLVSLLFGGGSNPVSLGGFVFQGFEVPERVNWGGAQRLVTHKMVGGGRFIDAMGRDDADISWSGIFLSSDASIRADQLDQMRIAGDPLELQFMGRQYTVLIGSFQAIQRRVNYVPYQITCVVLTDDSASAANQSPSLLSQLTNDLNSALGIDVPATLAAAQTALSSLAPVIAPLASLAPGSSAALSVVSGLASAQSLISSAQSVADGQVGGITAAAATAGNLLGSSNPTAAVTNLTEAVSALSTSSAAQAMSAYVSRMTANAGGA